MFKVFCLLAIVAAVSAGVSRPTYPGNPARLPPAAVHQPRIVKREAALDAEEPVKDTAVEEQDDMDKAETFGFGYRKVLHVYPSYYPRYYHGHHGYGYGYPSYHTGYHHGYYY